MQVLRRLLPPQNDNWAELFRSLLHPARASPSTGSRQALKVGVTKARAIGVELESSSQDSAKRRAEGSRKIAARQDFS